MNPICGWVGGEGEFRVTPDHNEITRRDNTVEQSVKGAERGTQRDNTGRPYNRGVIERTRVK